MLNWNFSTIGGFINSAIFLIAFIIALKYYLNRKYRFILDLSLIAACESVMYFLRGLSFLFLSTPLFLLCNYAMLFVLPISVAFYDTISHEHIGTWKMLAAGVFYAIIIFASLDPESVVEIINLTGNTILAWDANFQILGAIGLLCITILIFFPLLKTYLSVPQNLKRVARLFFVSFIVGLLGVVLSVFTSVHPIPGLIDATIAIEVILLEWIFIRKPQLGYVLPFKLNRLTVLSTASGIPIFDYIWSQTSSVDNTLYGGMLSGVNSIMQEFVGRGHIEEIKLHAARLVLVYNDQIKVMFVLVANQITRSLRQALDYFTSRFIGQYSDVIPDAVETSQFKSANKIIKECFEFVPG